MDPEYFAVIMLSIGLMGGLLLGSALVSWRWASNAKHPYRIEYRGRLYKTYDVTDLNWPLDPEDYWQAVAKACKVPEVTAIKKFLCEKGRMCDMSTRELAEALHDWLAAAPETDSGEE